MRERRRNNHRRLDQGPQGRAERPCFDEPAAGRRGKVSPLRLAPRGSGRDDGRGDAGEALRERRCGRDDGTTIVVSTKARRAARRDLASTNRRLVVERRSLRCASLREAPVETTGGAMRERRCGRGAAGKTTGQPSSSRPRPAGPRGETLLRRTGGWSSREGLSAAPRSARLRSRRREGRCGRGAAGKTTGQPSSSRPRPAGPRGETLLRRSGGWS